MNFANPRILGILAVVGPLLVIFLWWSWRKRIELTAAFIQARLLPNLTVGLSRRVQKTRLVLIVAAVVLLFLTLARPQWGFAWEEARQRGRDIVVAIDTSRSMLAEDIAPNRLTRAKLAALDLARLAKSDRLGLIAFAGTAFLQGPLTLDDEAFRQSVEVLDVGIIPQGGSSLADAIETASATFKDEGENHKVLILFSDGEEHEPAALEAAKKAAEKGLRIFTIGVGTPNGEMLRQRDEKGNVAFIKDDQGNAVKSALNEKLLQQIATAANGFYLPLQGARTMEVLYQRGLAPLPTNESSTQLVKQYKERFYWPLLVAILLLACEALLPEGPRRTRKQGREGESRALRQAVAALALLLWIQTASASPSAALRQYEEGKYKEAQREYEKLLEKRPDDARLRYNAGTAAYKAGDYEMAARQFQSALAAPDLKLQEKAFYNLGNTQFRAGEEEPDLNKKIESWETAAKHFDSAFKLDSKDEDARFNRDLVRKKIEELKKQQQDQKKNSNNQDKKDDKDQNKQDQQKKQDKQDKQDKDQKKDHSQEEKKKDDQQKQDQQKQQQQSQDQKQKEEEEKQKQQQQAQDKKGGKEEKKPQQSAGDKKDEQNPEDQQEAQPVQLGKMSPEQARKLLETARNEEKAMLFIPPPNKDQKQKSRLFKDW